MKTHSLVTINFRTARASSFRAGRGKITEIRGLRRLFTGATGISLRVRASR